MGNNGFTTKQCSNKEEYVAHMTQEWKTYATNVTKEADEDGVYGMVCMVDTGDSVHVAMIGSAMIVEAMLDKVQQSRKARLPIPLNLRNFMLVWSLGFLCGWTLWTVFGG